MYEKITSENVMMFAIKHYDNPQCEGEKEFHDDIKRFKILHLLLPLILLQLVDYL